MLTPSVSAVHCFCFVNICCLKILSS